MIKRVRVRIHTRKRQNIFFVAHRQKSASIVGCLPIFLHFSIFAVVLQPISEKQQAAVDDISIVFVLLFNTLTFRDMLLRAYDTA